MTQPPADRTVQDADAHRDGKITRDLVLTTALQIIEIGRASCRERVCT